MAKLKNTYIEGDLTVEGNLSISSISNPKGSNFPYIDKEDNIDINNRVVTFSNEEGGIVDTPLRISTEASKKEVIISAEDNSKNNLPILIDVAPDSLFLKKKSGSLKLNMDTQTWYF